MTEKQLPESSFPSLATVILCWTFLGLIGFSVHVGNYGCAALGAAALFVEIGMNCIVELRKIRMGRSS